MKKEYVGIIIVGNFYQYRAYKITDARRSVCYVAEPVGIGVTRGAMTLKELECILNLDVYALNHIWSKGVIK